MRRFAIFVTALFVLVVIASAQPRAVGSRRESVCVCMASKAQLIIRSLSNTTNARMQAPTQPHLTETALATE